MQNLPDHSPFEHRVGIIGAGPVGLALALRLSDHGIASVLYDENPGLKQEGSKACLIQGDVLEILDKSGCAAQVHREGVQWTHSNVYIRGDRIVRAQYDLGNRWGPFVNISQYRIEQILLAEIERRADIEVCWNARVEGVHPSADGVVLEVKRGARVEPRGFAYVAACNGVRSNVRDLLGVRWLGYRHTSQFLITDIRARLPFSKERHFHFDPAFNRGYQVIIHPQPDDVWRIDWQLPPTVDVAQDKRDGGLERRIRSVIGDVPYDLLWMSVYRFQQRRAERLVAGRVMLAGDAAHALPPYGSRGMNSGIQDADNLAWKLALVMRGCADSSLLETYHGERTAAAQENIDVTERTIRFMVPRNGLVRLRRQVLFTLARRFRGFRRFVNSGTMAQPHRYLASPLVQPPATSAAVGMFAADADLLVAGRPTKLRELLGHGFTFVHVGERAPAVLPALGEARVGLGPLPLSAVVIRVETARGADGAAAGSPAGPQVTQTPHVPHAPSRHLLAAQAPASILRHYEAGRWHLVRPDMHVASVFDGHRPDQFDVALRQASMAFAAVTRMPAGAGARAGADADTLAA